MARGGYTFEQIRKMSDEELFFLYHYQNLDRKDFIDDLSIILGVLWKPESFVENKGEKKPETLQDLLENITNKTVNKRLTVPLSVAINPKILDFVKSQGITADPDKFSGTVAQGDYSTVEGEKVISLASLPKDEFKKIMGMGVTSKNTQEEERIFRKKLKEKNKNTSSFT